MKHTAPPRRGDRSFAHARRRTDPRVLRRPSGRRLSARAFAVALCVAGVGLVGCSDSSFEVGSELSIELSVPATAPLSDSVDIEYEARGRSLLGMIVEYGDGTADSVSFVGSQSAGGRVRHKYDAAGDYRISGTVQDGIEGSESAEADVTITP